jgi:hypothetical protein
MTTLKESMNNTMKANFVTTGILQQTPPLLKKNAENNHAIGQQMTYQDERNLSLFEFETYMDDKGKFCVRMEGKAPDGKKEVRIIADKIVAIVTKRVNDEAADVVTIRPEILRTLTSDAITEIRLTDVQMLEDMIPYFIKGKPSDKGKAKAATYKDVANGFDNCLRKAIMEEFPDRINAMYPMPVPEKAEEKPVKRKSTAKATMVAKVAKVAEVVEEPKVPEQDAGESSKMPVD